MTKLVKTLILIVVLLLPTAIFLFLYQFGNNEFDVKVQHPEGLGLPGCPDYGSPHKLPIVDSLGLNEGTYDVVYLQNRELSKAQLNELRRLSINNPSVEFLIFFRNESNKQLATGYQQDNWRIFVLENLVFEELNRCVFGNINNLPLVLADPKRHIRGYYELDNKKELDRLEGEIKILME